METFAVDKCFYDIGASDLRDLWDSDLDPDVLKISNAVDGGSDMSVEWSFLDRDPMLPGVILHDRLMTDAIIGTLPIKTEHSYSLSSDGDSLPESPISHHRIDIDDDFPTICVNPASVRSSSSPVTITIKDEPLSEPESPTSSCPGSPSPLPLARLHQTITKSNATTTTTLTTINATFTTEEETENDIDMDTIEDISPQYHHQTMLKPSNLPCSARTSIFSSHQSHRLGVPKFNIKVEPTTSSGFSLPPTPPSCSSSEESEDNAPCSQPSSPSRLSRPNARVLLTSQSSTRQPIHTPLISTQPKGSTGMLVLTEEEKRTLLAEGYPVPTRLPLTKAEEKSLKKIRRKIKNKISAQESRRKKKEYMDQLERKVEILVSENSDYRKKIENLEGTNNKLLEQLTRLQALVARHPQVLSRHGK